MVSSDNAKLIAMELAEEILACPAAAQMSEVDQEIWLFICYGGLDDGINDERWANRIFEGLYMLNRIERGDWQARDTATGAPIDYHAAWVADDGPRGKK